MNEDKALFLNRSGSGWAELFRGSHAFRYSLLLAPVFVVLLYQVGRGLGNTSYVLYWLIAVGLLVRTRSLVFPPFALGLYIALLAWGTLSASLSINPDGAYGKWAQYALLGSSYFVSWALVRTIPEFSLERAIRMIGIAGLIGFAYYAAQFLILSTSPNFHPEVQVHGLVPAYLAPFALYLIWQSIGGKRRIILSLAYLVSLAVLLVFSNSLTEVVTLAGALAVLVFFLVPNKRLLALVLGAIGLVFIGLILAFDPAGHVVSQAEHTHESWFAFLNQLSSFRTQLWYQAITIPPPNQWLGVGPSNVGLYPAVAITASYRVGHLHNLLLDCWYELGFVGAGLYALFYGAQSVPMKTATDKLRSLQYGVMYAAVGGVFVSTMLEQSYRSIHAALFVPFLLALYGFESSGARSQEKT